jgi:hypothetical protein
MLLFLPCNAVQTFTDISDNPAAAMVGVDD